MEGVDDPRKIEKKESKKWNILVGEKSKRQSRRESKRGKKGLAGKGRDLGKREKKKQENGEGGALVSFKVVKTNQYGKKQKRLVAEDISKTNPKSLAFWRYLRLA